MCEAVEEAGPRERERPQEEEPQEGEVSHRNKKYTLSLVYTIYSKAKPVACAILHSTGNNCG